MSATCGNCRHFDEDFQWVSNDGLHDGICMGAPPTAVVRGWEFTRRAMHCGAWSPRVPSPDPAPPEPGD